MNLTEMVGMADDRIDRGILMKAAANGDVEAQRALLSRYAAWVYSPGEREAFMQRRDDLYVPSRRTE